MIQKFGQLNENVLALSRYHQGEVAGPCHRKDSRTTEAVNLANGHRTEVPRRPPSSWVFHTDDLAPACTQVSSREGQLEGRGLYACGDKSRIPISRSSTTDRNLTHLARSVEKLEALGISRIFVRRMGRKSRSWFRQKLKLELRYPASIRHERWFEVKGLPGELMKRKSRLEWRI